MKIYLHVQVNKGQSHILPTVPLEGVLCNGPYISNEEVLYCNNNFKKPLLLSSEFDVIKRVIFHYTPLK